MIRYYIFIIFLVSAISACSNNDTKLAAYRIDAKRYCEVHSIQYWKSIGKYDALKKMRPNEKQYTLSRAFRNSIKTEEMYNMVFDQGKKIDIRKFYSYLKEQIPRLTQQPFNCPAIAKFYYSS